MITRHDFVADRGEIELQLWNTNSESTLKKLYFQISWKLFCTSKSPKEICDLFLTSVFKYRCEEDIPQALADDLYQMIPGWIDAVVLDQDMAKAAKEELNKILGQPIELI